MPSSTLLQLVARGRQDAYLTGTPQFTYFKQVYRRYTPFAIESIPIELDGAPDFGKRVSCVIPRKAELLGAMFLEVDLPALPDVSAADGSTIPVYWANSIGHLLIDTVSVEIGDKEIDKHTGAWLQIWSELTTPAEKRDGFNEMVGQSDVFPTTAQRGPLRLTIPLRFWFNTTLGAALPLIALQAHPVRLIFHLRRFQDCWWTEELLEPPAPGTPCPTVPPVAPTRLQLFGDYIFLDTPERQRFAAAEHEYLITQLQYSPPQSIPAAVTTANIPLTFNHACTEFIWTVQQDRIAAAHEWFNFSNRLNAGGGESATILTDPLESALIRLDGYERFQRRYAQYFRITQPYQYHTVIPRTADDYIYLYSFATRPEDYAQPSGTINCSKIDDIALNLTFSTTPYSTATSPPPATPTPSSWERTVVVYTVNYNVLRVVGGLGGLAFIA